jgi:hypothetical protein
MLAMVQIGVHGLSAGVGQLIGTIGMRMSGKGSVAFGVVELSSRGNVILLHGRFKRSGLSQLILI